jgi:hypothetical protein
VSIARGTILHRHGDILHGLVGSEEVLMMCSITGRYYGVSNAAGRRIWELIEEPMSIAEICSRLCQEFEVDAQDCEAAVLKFANDMVDNGIIHAE